MSHTKTHAQFVSQVSHLPITVMGEYIGNRQRIEIKCDECNHEWKMRVDHVVSGRSCPVCSKLRVAREQSKSQEQFINEMKEEGITVIGKYVNRNTEVLVICDECSREWNMIPSNFKACIKCSAIRSGKEKRIIPEILNDYGDWVEFIATGMVVQIDKSDFTKLVTRSVCLDQNEYPVIGDNNKKCGNSFLHKLIMNRPDSLVDHIDRNPRNNRRSNLRYVTRSQNAMNSKCRSDSGTGVRGISLTGRVTKKWEVRIHADGQTHYLGRFTNLGDAIIARKKGEKKYFGEYAPK